MNVIAAAREHNQKAVRQKWNHFCDPTLAFSLPRYDNLVAIWRAKAAGRTIPRRSDVTPRDLKDFLRDIVLAQRIATDPSCYVWRIIGTGLTDILGHNTGKTFEQSVPPEHLPRWLEVPDLVLASQQPLRVRGRVHIQDRDYLDAENLYLPLADYNDVPSYVLGLCRYTRHTIELESAWENEMVSVPGGLL
jgi:hypothetical protein